MKKNYAYFYGILLPIVVLALFFFIYKKAFCYFSNSSPDARLVCELNWKDGLILLCCYLIVKVLSPPLQFDTVFKRVGVSILLYCFAYALIAFPFWIASFFQPFIVNAFVHVLVLIIIVETLIGQKDDNMSE